MLVASLLGCVCHVKTALWSAYWVPFESPFALVFWFVMFVLLAVLWHDRPRLFPTFHEKGKTWFIACNSCITVTGCAGRYISYKFWKNGSCWILPLWRWLISVCASTFSLLCIPALGVSPGAVSEAFSPVSVIWNALVLKSYSISTFCFAWASSSLCCACNTW